MPTPESPFPERQPGIRDLPDLTWASLLARWMEFARSSAALPRTVEGDRWRRSVAPIIELQAVTHALAELERITDSEAALGIARSDVIIDRAEESLLRTWGVTIAADLHPELVGLIGDARLALDAARKLYGAR